MFEETPTGTLDQGDIVAGLSARGYEHEQTFGVIVTARCDLANDKVDIVNYVPVVPLRAWFDVDGWRAVALIEYNNHRDRFLRLAEKAAKVGLTRDHIQISLEMYGGFGTLRTLREHSFKEDEELTRTAKILDDLKDSVKKNKRPARLDEKLIRRFAKTQNNGSLLPSARLPFTQRDRARACCAPAANLRHQRSMPQANDRRWSDKAVG